MKRDFLIDILLYFYLNFMNERLIRNTKLYYIYIDAEHSLSSQE